MTSMSFLADLLSTVFERGDKDNPSISKDRRTIKTLSLDLLSSKGEVSGTALARQILARYETLSIAKKTDFFKFLAHKMDINPAKVRHTLKAYEEAPGNGSYREFMAAAEPQRQELARRLNQVTGGTEQLVNMRSDLLTLLQDNPDLAPVDLDFRHLFGSWFNRGFLVLRPISWESPAHILEKIIAYEAVHAIGSWDDLRLRLEPSDRRCFAFFHPSMPNEPLIFVEVALTKGIPGSVQELLAEDRDRISAGEADTAVFYSISNCQVGLAGVSFGNSLIKQVVEDLSRELTGLLNFVTLSPIPKLLSWVASSGLAEDFSDPDQQEAIAAQYLLTAKRSDGSPFDPVARFHLGNGALVHAVHKRADVSENGLEQSGGVMVNYLYDRAQIAANHEGYASEKEIAASKNVSALCLIRDKKEK